MADNKDGRTEVLDDLDFNSIEDQWRKKQLGPGQQPPNPQQGFNPQGGGFPDPAGGFPPLPPLPQMPGAPGQDATAAIDLTDMELEPDMATINLSLDQLSPHLTGGLPLGLGGPGGGLGMGSPAPGVGGMDTATEALRLEDVNMAIQGTNKVIVGGDTAAEAHYRTTAAMQKIERSADQVQIHGTGSHPIYQPEENRKTGLIIGVVILILVLVGGGVTAVLMMGDDGGSGETEEKKPNTPPKSAAGASTIAEAVTLGLTESWAATLGLDNFVPTILDNQPIAGEAVVFFHNGITTYINGVEVPSEGEVVGALAQISSASTPILIIPNEDLQLRQLLPVMQAAHDSKRPFLIGGQDETGGPSGIPLTPFKWGENSANVKTSEIQLKVATDGLVLITPNPAAKNPPPAPKPAPDEKKDGEKKDGEKKDGEKKDGEKKDGEKKDGEKKDGEKKDGEKKDGADGSGEAVVKVPEIPKTLELKLPHPMAGEAPQDSALAVALLNARSEHSVSRLRVIAPADLKVMQLIPILQFARVQEGKPVFETILFDMPK